MALVPPPDLLSARLTIDGAPQAPEGVELVVRLDGTDLGPSGAWVSAPVPSVSVLVTVALPGRQLLLTLPPGPLGLGLGNPEDDQEVQAVSLDQAERRSRKATVASAELARTGPGRLSARLAGTLPAGSPWALTLEGGPTVAQATVLAAEGRERAAALLHRALPGLDLAGEEASETRSGAPGDETLLLRWQPAVLTELEEAQRAASERREDEAEERRLEALRARPVPEPTEAAPLVAGRLGHEVVSATLTLLGPDPGPGGFQLGFEVQVGERSGEDGALGPSLHYQAAAAPFTLAVDGGWRTLAPGPGVIEAWYGNDAPELLEHRFAFRLLPGAEAEVDWSCRYQDWTTRQEEALRFRGRARVERRGLP